MGDRLTAGLWTLDPSIGVRIPVPQLSRGGFFAPAFQLPLLGFVTDVNLFDHGACSSMAEHLIVDQDVVGSSPIKRPSTFHSNGMGIYYKSGVRPLGEHRFFLSSF